MINFKSVARRGTSFVAALSLLSGIGTSLAPVLVHADALNPLTERSLTLSSSSPGWANTDGSGNSTYAPPNSGANGQKSGNYFDFKVSTDTSGGSGIKAMSFQYCTKSAGSCGAPGDNSPLTGSDDATHADLNVTYPSAAEVGSSDFSTVVDSTSGAVKAVPGYTNNNPKYITGGGTGDPAEAAKSVAGNFIVMTKSGGTWSIDNDWTATTSNQEEPGAPQVTGKQNTIILQKSTGELDLPSGTEVKVLFFATGSDYITNPGSGAFFVKINTFNTFPALSSVVGSENTLKDNIDHPGYVIDGGVTVANVMNQSIQITTKVLETMQFSVGTVDPDTLDATQLGNSEAGSRIPCNQILTRMTSAGAQNVLQLGDQGSESSLETTQTYATHSYWRLSSNSSAGATVYYSGHTLSNTSGDEISPIGTAAAASAPGSEQFGLALDTIALAGSTGVANLDNGTYGVDYSTAPGIYENGADNSAAGIAAAGSTPGAGGVDDSVLTGLGATHSGSWVYTGLNKSYHTPKLDPLAPTSAYGQGSGGITGPAGAGQAEFAFDKMSDTIPAPIATEHTQVVDCVTGKMRYIANIAATTPAGIYTTKINYIAAPQY